MATVSRTTTVCGNHHVFQGGDASGQPEWCRAAPTVWSCRIIECAISRSFVRQRKAGPKRGRRLPIARRVLLSSDLEQSDQFVVNKDDLVSFCLGQIGLVKGGPNRGICRAEISVCVTHGVSPHLARQRGGRFSQLRPFFTSGGGLGGPEDWAERNRMASWCR